MTAGVYRPRRNPANANGTTRWSTPAGRVSGADPGHDFEPTVAAAHRGCSVRGVGIATTLSSVGTMAHITRRSALRRVLGWPVAIGALATTGMAAFVLACRGRRRPQGVPVTPLANVPPGSAFRARLGEDPVIVVNVGGEIRAFAAVCTHEGCPLGWNPDQHLIRCPCHGGAYDTSGRVVDGPPPRALQRLPAEVADGTVFVSPTLSAAPALR